MDSLNGFTVFVRIAKTATSSAFLGVSASAVTVAPAWKKLIRHIAPQHHLTAEAALFLDWPAHPGRGQAHPRAGLRQSRGTPRGLRSACR